ncbi:MAG: DUF222 domain-containing protein, partial [Acidimicrobiaceae bacterium]|nr:DUF222 domain-containing protein [Acidimicrobiaceae bacterium]
MESRTGSVESIDTAGAGCVACAAGVEVAALSDGELVERMTQLGRGRSRMDAMLAETAAEMQRRSGGRATVAVMRERLHVSSLQATADTALAASLADEYPSTLEAWRAGEITAGHARVIARVGADPEHADEPSLLQMARGYPVDMFARMTRQYMSSQDSAEEHQRQHQNRWASLVQDPDGSWRLSAYFGADTGKRVSVAFNAMVRTYRHGTTVYGSGPIQGLTSQQRRADALANLITGEGAHERPSTTLLVIADYDTVSRELCNLRYDDGVPVAADQIAKLAAEARILPAIFNVEGDPLWLGRAERHASAGQRIVLAARDGGCVNCAAPAEGGEPHHIEWFVRGGPTDIDNLFLLCERCPHLVHDDGWQLHSDNGQLG